MLKQKRTRSDEMNWEYNFFLVRNAGIIWMWACASNAKIHIYTTNMVSKRMHNEALFFLYKFSYEKRGVSIIIALHYAYKIWKEKKIRWKNQWACKQNSTIFGCNKCKLLKMNGGLLFIIFTLSWCRKYTKSFKKAMFLLVFFSWFSGECDQFYDIFLVIVFSRKRFTLPQSKSYGIWMTACRFPHEERESFGLLSMRHTRDMRITIREDYTDTAMPSVIDKDRKSE